MVWCYSRTKRKTVSHMRKPGLLSTMKSRWPHDNPRSKKYIYKEHGVSHVSVGLSTWVFLICGDRTARVSNSCPRCKSNYSQIIILKYMPKIMGNKNKELFWVGRQIKKYNKYKENQNKRCTKAGRNTKTFVCISWLVNAGRVPNVNRVVYVSAGRVVRSAICEDRRKNITNSERTMHFLQRRSRNQESTSTLRIKARNAYTLEATQKLPPFSVRSSPVLVELPRVLVELPVPIEFPVSVVLYANTDASHNAPHWVMFGLPGHS